MKRIPIATMLLLLAAATALAGGKVGKPAPSQVRGKAAFAPNKQDLDWLVASLPKARAALSTMQLASRQDRIAELRRRAAESYLRVLDDEKSRTGDKAAAAVARAAEIYYSQLKEVKRAMEVYEKLVKHYKNTAPAKAAIARAAGYYQSKGEYKPAIEKYELLIKDHKDSPALERAYFALAQCQEKLHEWVKAINAYEEYLRVYPKGKQAAEAREQVQWIRTYHQVGAE